MPLIRLKNIHKAYRMGDAEVTALKGIDLTVNKGEFIAIWGPSGSGKSTLCNVIGLLDAPTRGSYRLNGHDVSMMNDDHKSELRNRVIGLVFQNFNLVPVLSAVENVILPMEIKWEKRAKARLKAENRLMDLGMGDFSHHHPHKLSGGQQQRVAIARALINDPKLVIADEPTANLDSKTARSIIDLMRAINHRSGATFIFSTHDQRLLDRVNRRLLLEDGTIVEDKTYGGTSHYSGAKT